MIFSPFPFNETLYDICSWLKHGGLPVIVLDQGRFPPQMLPLLEEQPSLSLMSGTEKTLSVWGPEPGQPARAENCPLAALRAGGKGERRAPRRRPSRRPSRQASPNPKQTGTMVAG